MIIRFVMLWGLYPLLNWVGKPITWREVTVMCWGGLGRRRKEKVWENEL